jgi:hypothetical protein
VPATVAKLYLYWQIHFNSTWINVPIRIIVVACVQLRETSKKAVLMRLLAKFYSTLAVACLAGAWLSVGVLETANAGLVASEGFDYANGTALAGQNGGTGWNGGWNAVSSSALATVNNGAALTGLDINFDSISLLANRGGVNFVSQTWTFDNIRVGTSFGAIAVPELSSMLLMGAFLAMMGVVRRRTV